MTKYQKLINWIDKNLTWLNCEDVVVRIKYGKDKKKKLVFNLSDDWIKELKNKLEEIKTKSSYLENDNDFTDILKEIKDTLAEQEICNYLEKIFGKERDQFNFEEAIKSDNLLYLKHYFDTIGKYSALRKIYEKLLSYGKKNKSFDKEGFYKFVFYQSGRGVISWKWMKFADLVKKVIDKIEKDLNNNENKYKEKDIKNFYEASKVWLSAIIAYYVYFEWTKN